MVEDNTTQLQTVTCIAHQHTTAQLPQYAELRQYDLPREADMSPLTTG